MSFEIPLANPWFFSMGAPPGAPAGAYFYTLTWAQLFMMLFALIAEFERRLTTDDSFSETSSEHEVVNDDRIEEQSQPSNAALIPAPPPYPPPWYPRRRGNQQDDQCSDRERSPRT